ncbi:hypothetical protein Tco_1226707 [Tanacetum coccineum]
MDRIYSEQAPPNYLAKHEEREKREHESQKHHLGLHLISHPSVHHLHVHLELQELLVTLDCLQLPPPPTITHPHPPTEWSVNLKQDWWKPLSEEDRPATPEPAWSIPSSDLPVPMNN